MQNRRKFLLQTTLAAGSFVFSKPLKAAALSPSNLSPDAQKLTILNVNALHTLPGKSPFSSSVNKLSTVFKNENYNTLLLSTGNSIGSKNTSKASHLENLTWLKTSGCDAIVPTHNDLQNGFPYYKALTDESNLMSLGGGTNQTTGSNLLPYHITMKGSIKVGIIGNGLLHADAPVKDNLEEIASQLNETAALLKTVYYCNVIVSMNPYNSHLNACPKNPEKELAALTKNIDVIVSSNSAQKNAVTYIVKNALRNEVVLNYQGSESPALKCIDISLNSKMEKTNFTLRRVV